MLADVPARRGSAKRGEPARGAAVLPLPGVDVSWLLGQLFEQSPLGFGIVDRELRYVLVNDALARLNRREREQHPGRTVDEVLGALPGGPEIIALVHRALEGEMISGVVSDPHDTQPQVHFAAHYWPLRDDGGHVQGVAALIKPTSPGREVSEALARSEAHYRLLVELSGQIVWSARPDGHVEFVNRRFREVTGLGLEDAQGQRWHSLVHPEDRARVEPQRRAAFVAGNTFIGEYRLRCRDGQYRYHLVQAQPVRDPSGRVQRYIGVSTDIHDHRQLEYALRRYQLLSSHTRDIILFVCATTGRILEANEAATQAYGRPHEELCRLRIADLRAPHRRAGLDEEMERVARASRTSGGHIFDTEHVRADGTFFPVEVSTVLTSLGGEELFVSVVRDISARRRAERERDDNERFREMFVGVLGHDLRTPLSAILTSADLMLSRGGLDERQRGTLERIAASSQRMGGMITQILDLTRSRLAGGFPIERVPCRLRDVVGRVVEDQRLLDAAAGMEVAVEGDDAGRFDPDRLLQMFQNLIENALRHGERGRPVRIAIHGEAERVSVAIHNHGPAIAEGELAHLFDPFRKGSQRRSSGGLGLGLYIAREIVHAHGGEITVQSCATDGTTFRVLLPRTAPSAS